MRGKPEPLADMHRQAIQIAMQNAQSLADITKTTGVTKVINYLLADKPALEQYLSVMAAKFTCRRQQISHSALILSIFHYEMASLSLYEEGFRIALIDIVEKEREIQRRKFIAENNLQINIRTDVWRLYELHGQILRLKTVDFTKISQPSLRYEMKFYLKYTFESRGKINIPLFCCQYLALNTLVENNPNIKFFADITETDAKMLVISLERTTKDDGTSLSQYYISKAVNSIRRVVDYLIGDFRDSKLKAPKPYMNPFAIISFHNLRQYNVPTTIIPEEVVEQLDQCSKELPPLHKLLYDIFSNTGLRLKEVFFLEEDCIETSRYPGIFQLKFKPHKVLTSRRRHGAGDYHRIMIPQGLADELSAHISSTQIRRQTVESPYIFLSERLGYATTVMDSQPFIKSVRYLIKKHNICDEDGKLWHFTSRQFRKTIAVKLIENGATTAELAYWLGHLCSDTAAKYYAEVRKMKLAELNTRFFLEKFELIISNEQLENYTEEERKLLYADFRLEQRRVELGFCMIKAADGPCQNRKSLYNCINCRNLCTGKQYLPYWLELLEQQKIVVEKLISTYIAEGISDYTNYTEYRQEFRLLNGYENIVKAIQEGGTTP